MVDKETCFIVLCVGMMSFGMMAILIPSMIDAYGDSSDYIGEGQYGCPECDWVGNVGEMNFHDGSFFVPDKYYCPECGHEIDVRG